MGTWVFEKTARLRAQKKKSKASGSLIWISWTSRGMLRRFSTNGRGGDHSQGLAENGTSILGGVKNVLKSSTKKAEISEILEGEQRGWCFISGPVLTARVLVNNRVPEGDQILRIRGR